MEQIKLELPKFAYKSLMWEDKDNITYEGRAQAFEDQNRKYFLAGFNKENTKYKQAFSTLKEHTDFADTLFDRYTIAFMYQLSGQTLPSHVDTFYMVSKKFGVDPKDCCRVNIFLEDWKSGHYFEINDTPILQWKRGDAIIIEKDEPHLSANNGMQPKYTMQITGVKNEFKRRKAS